MFWRVRSFWLAAGAVAYVAFAALVAEDAPSPFPSPPSTVLGRGLPWIALVALPAALAVVWTFTAPPSRGEDRVEQGARDAARACFAGAAVAPRGAHGPGRARARGLGQPRRRPELDGGARRARAHRIARRPRGPARLRPPPRRRRVRLAALDRRGRPPGRARPGPRRAAELDPVLIDYATVAASLGSLGLVIASAYRVRARRRLELGVADRAASALVLARRGGGGRRARLARRPSPRPSASCRSAWSRPRAPISASAVGPRSHGPRARVAGRRSRSRSSPRLWRSSRRP